MATKAFHCCDCGEPTPGTLEGPNHEKICPWCLAFGGGREPEITCPDCGIGLHPERGCPCGWAVLFEKAEKELSGWTVHHVDGWEVVEANSWEEAIKEAEELVRDMNPCDLSETYWVRVTITSPDGEERIHKVQVDPEEPVCSSDDGEHDWTAPIAEVGGLEENPGVFGHGGGIISHEICAHCGLHRKTDTWAQDRSDGEQGLTMICYEET